jgi:hypothetical protein
MDSVPVIVRLLSTLTILVMLVAPVMAVELFRYRGAARDGGTLEYVFGTDRQDVPATATKRMWLRSLPTS